MIIHLALTLCILVILLFLYHMLKDQKKYQKESNQIGVLLNRN